MINNDPDTLQIASREKNKDLVADDPVEANSSQSVKSTIQRDWASGSAGCTKSFLLYL